MSWHVAPALRVRTGLEVAPFSDTDLDDVIALAFEHTAGVISHAAGSEPEPFATATATATEWVIATLAVSGPWECELTLCVESSLAATLTESMWDQNAVSAADVDDAIGELANVVAGGVKGMTPHPGCDLSTPAVSRGMLPSHSTTMRRSYLVMNRPAVLFIAL